MQTNMRDMVLGRSARLLLVAAFATAAACGDDTSNKGKATDLTGKPLYVVPTEIYAPDQGTSTSYLPVTSSLDVPRIELDKAREVSDRASVYTLGDWLFVASYAAPVVERFTVNADGSLEFDKRLNFAKYSVPQYFSIDDWGAVFVSAEKAYIFNNLDGSHIVWNPTTMEITGTIPGPKDIVKEGYAFESVALARGNRLYRLFTLLNYDTWEFLPDPQYLAVYDTDNDTLLSVKEDHRCPQLYNRPFVDEAGDIYFSGWLWSAGLSLTSDYPKSCALRVKAGADAFDPEWQLNFAADITDGREAAVLRYLGDGKALLDVFHDERVTIDAKTDAQELASSANWRLWSIDLNTKKGAPLEGLDFKAGGYTDVKVGARNFLLVPNDDYTETTAHEIKDGVAVPGFKIKGSTYNVVQLRE